MPEDSEFGKGFADDHDDWGMKVNPEELNTLHCLNGHLSAEEDYYPDPRRRPYSHFTQLTNSYLPMMPNLRGLCHLKTFAQMI